MRSEPVGRVVVLRRRQVVVGNSSVRSEPIGRVVVLRRRQIIVRGDCMRSKGVGGVVEQRARQRHIAGDDRVCAKRITIQVPRRIDVCA